MKAPPLLPEEIFQRVLRLARFDGWSVVMVASIGAVLAASSGDPVGAGVGVLVAGAGMVELHGVTLLRHGDARGMTWLINSQCLIMLSLFGYSAIRLAHPQLEPLRVGITEDMKQQLASIGWTVDQFLELVFRVVYLGLSLATFIYQGAMAIYYFRRRPAVTTALTEV